MQNQNLFALLPDDADDVSFVIPSSNDAVAATADPKNGSAGLKKKPSNQSSDGSDPRDKRLNLIRFVNRRDGVVSKSKPEVQGTGYQQRSVGSNNYRSSNVGSNRGGANLNGSYKGNSFQKNYSRPNTNQDSYGARGGRGYGGRGRGRDNSGEPRFNEYSNGFGNYSQIQPRRGNGRGYQINPIDSEVLKSENSKVQNNSQTEIKDSVGEDSEGWQVVSRRKQASVANSEVRSEVSYNSKDDQIDVFGWRSNGVNGQTGNYSRGNGTYHREQGGNSTKSVASNNSEAKDDIGDAAQSGNVNLINAKFVGGDISVQDEEKRKRHDKWLKENEEDEKKMTLKQYEEQIKEKKKNAMQPVGEKKDSVSVTDMAVPRPQNSNKKKVTTSPIDSVCKSIVQGFMKTASFQRRYNRPPEKGSYQNGNGFSNKGNVGDGSYRQGNVAKGFSDKVNVGEDSSNRGNVAKGFSDKGNVGEDSDRKGNVAKSFSDKVAGVEGSYRQGTAPAVKGSTFEGNLPKEKGVEMKTGNIKVGKNEAKRVDGSLQFDDHSQFPALK